LQLLSAADARTSKASKKEHKDATKEKKKKGKVPRQALASWILCAFAYPNAKTRLHAVTEADVRWPHAPKAKEARRL
jgi:hypothetical protein